VKESDKEPAFSELTPGERIYREVGVTPALREAWNKHRKVDTALKWVTRAELVLAIACLFVFFGAAFSEVSDPLLLIVAIAFAMVLGARLWHHIGREMENRW
jgi:hypothetical protein